MCPELLCDSSSCEAWQALRALARRHATVLICPTSSSLVHRAQIHRRTFGGRCADAQKERSQLKAEGARPPLHGRAGGAAPPGLPGPRSSQATSERSCEADHSSPQCHASNTGKLRRLSAVYSALILRDPIVSHLLSAPAASTDGLAPASKPSHLPCGAILPPSSHVRRLRVLTAGQPARQRRSGLRPQVLEVKSTHGTRECSAWNDPQMPPACPAVGVRGPAMSARKSLATLRAASTKNKASDCRSRSALLQATALRRAGTRQGRACHLKLL